MRAKITVCEKDLDGFRTGSVEGTQKTTKFKHAAGSRERADWFIDQGQEKDTGKQYGVNVNGDENDLMWELMIVCGGNPEGRRV